MKRFFLLLQAVLLSASALWGQGREIGGGLYIDMGLKAGANLSQIKGSGWDADYKANFLGGLYLALNTRLLGLQAEGLFVQTTYVVVAGASQLPGAFYANAADSVKGGSFRVNYLSVPVLLNIRLFGKATIQLGPQYNGIVSVEDKKALLTDARALFKDGTLSGVAGLKIRLSRHVSFGARYVFGLSDTQNKSTFKNFGKYRNAWNERSIQVALGYSF